MLRRMRHKNSPFAADRTHIHHVLEHAGLSAQDRPRRGDPANQKGLFKAKGILDRSSIGKYSGEMAECAGFRDAVLGGAFVQGTAPRVRFSRPMSRPC